MTRVWAPALGSRPPPNPLSSQVTTLVARTAALHDGGHHSSARGQDGSPELQSGAHAPAIGRLPPAGEDGRDSPHPCAIHGSARAAEMPDSTALCRRSLIRMRPLVQVQPGPLTGIDLPKRSSAVSFDGGRSVSSLPTAVLERIPALLPSDDFGSRVGRRGGCRPAYGDTGREQRSGANRYSVVNPNRQIRRLVLSVHSDAGARDRHLRQGHVPGRLGATLGRHDHLIITLFISRNRQDPALGALWSGGGRLTF